MPGTTPTYGITYPLPTDPLADGADAIRDTAETVEAALVGTIPAITAARDSAVATIDAEEAAAVAAVGAAQSTTTAFRRVFLYGGS